MDRNDQSVDSLVPLDGFGIRRTEMDPRHGRVEVLSLVPKLATAEAEQAIRVRAAKLAECGGAPLALVHRVDRDDNGRLAVMSSTTPGLRLSTLLAHLRAGKATLSGAATLEVASAVIRAVASLHEVAGTPGHGAINPAHIVLTSSGGAVLTDAVFGGALEALQLNRDQLWRQFLLAMPAAANLPRFDLRSDVTQMAATVLGVLLHRPLTASEYPSAVADLLVPASEQLPVSASSVHMFLQRALQLHARATFSDGVEAAAGFAHVMVTAPGRRAAVQELQFVLRQVASGAGPRRPAAAEPALIPESALPPSTATLAGLF